MITNTKNIANGVVFIIILLSGLLLFMLLPKSGFDENEKKALAEVPEITGESIISGQYFKDMDSFINDQFPLRSSFIAANAYIKTALGNLSQNGVYLTHKGYLVTTPVIPDDRLSTNIRLIRSFIDSAGIKAQLLPVPEAGYIMEKDIAGVHAPYSDDKILAALSECGEVIDIRDAMRRAEKVYYKTDHHWTSEGAYLAYREFCKANSLEARGEAKYRKTIIDGFKGTTYSKSGLYAIKPEEIELWNNGNKTDISIEDIDMDKSSSADSPFDKSYADKGDKYCVFLGGNHSIVNIQTQNTGDSLLIIKDSYANSFAPFLTDNFSKIILLDLRYYRRCDILDMIKRENIGSVLFLCGAGTFAESSDFTFLK